MSNVEKVSPIAASAVATQRRSHRMPQGAEILQAGGVRFRLWAPGCDNVKLSIAGRDDPLPMEVAGEGWHELTTQEAGTGTHYCFVLPDGSHIADPASRYQPHDVHGRSEVIDPLSYTWGASLWSGRPWHEIVLYELHIGSFTAEGTFRAAIGKLDHLRQLGVTAIEIMPVADFPGKRNWGYDGVLLYAPDSTYGRPEDMKALVEAAHARGIAVILDVVYNHFGPDGNYLPTIAPTFFTDRHKTPWGDAVNFDGEGSRPVRDFVIHNALYWLEEFHLDGLRFDAVHAIQDDSSHHVLDELAQRARDRVQDRPIHLILENDDNQARRLTRGPDNDPETYTAQWNDDLHHVLHVAATDENSGYYADYQGDTEKLGRALAQGFAFQGETTSLGKSRGEPSAQLPPSAFVTFIQNHDQIGNRAFGDRAGAIISPGARRAIAVVYLLLPQIPMLFMGEEWGATQPFPYFCDFGEELGKAVSEGRRNEFAGFPEFQDEKQREQIPDPQAESTFNAAKLRWSDRKQEPYANWLDWYMRLLAVRHEVVVPMVPHIVAGKASYRVVSDGAVLVTWPLASGGELHLAANLSPLPAKFPLATSSTTVWHEGEIGRDGSLGPWAVLWAMTTT